MRLNVYRFAPKGAKTSGVLPLHYAECRRFHQPSTCVAATDEQDSGRNPTAGSLKTAAAAVEEAGGGGRRSAIERGGDVGAGEEVELPVAGRDDFVGGYVGGHLIGRHGLDQVGRDQNEQLFLDALVGGVAEEGAEDG